MRVSRLVGGLLLGSVAAAGALFVMRRRATAAPRADLYFADGSSLSLDREAPEAGPIFATARSLAGTDA